MKNKIELGDTVQCKYSGFKGVAVARTEFINCCIQYSVLPPVNKKTGDMAEELGIDEGSLKIVSRAKKETPKKKKMKAPGGPTRTGVKQRGY